MLEAAERAGGRILSEPRRGVWLNFGAHVFGGRESDCGSAAGPARRSCGTGAGRLAAVSLNGKIVSRGPVESFPLRLPMPLRSRLALLRTGLGCASPFAGTRRSRRHRDGEDPADRQRRMLDFLDDRSFAEFAGTASRGRRRGVPLDADALLGGAGGARSGVRRRVLPPRVGSGREACRAISSGGSGHRDRRPRRTLGDECASGRGWSPGRTHACRRAGSTLRTGRRVEARVAIVATPAYATREIVADLPAETAAALAAIPVRALRRRCVPHARDRRRCRGTTSTRSRRRSDRSACCSTPRTCSDGARQPRGPGWQSHGLRRGRTCPSTRRRSRTMRSRDLFLADLHAVLPATREHRRGGRDQAVGARAPVPAGRSRPACRRRSPGR